MKIKFEPFGISEEMHTFLSEHLHKGKQELIQERLKIRKQNSEQATALNALIKYHIRENAAPSNIKEAVMAYKAEHTILQKNKNVPNLDPIKASEQAIAKARQRLLSAEETKHYINSKHKLLVPLKIQKSIDELIGSPSDIINGIGELTEKSNAFQRIAHISDATASGLNTAGGIGSSIAGGFNLFTVSYKCIKERRPPTSYERAKMLHSAIIITLAALALTGVGGPIAVSIFAANIVYLTFSKTVAEMFRDSFRLKNARIARDEALKNNETLAHQIKQVINETQAITDALKTPLSNQEKTVLIAQLKTQNNQLNSLNIALKLQDKALIRIHYKYEILQKRHENQLEKIRKGFTIAAGIISIVGASLTLTPLAPIGFILLGLGAAISLLSIAGFGIARYLENRRQKKQLELEKSADAVSNKEEITLSDSLMAKELGIQAHPSANTAHDISENKAQEKKHTELELKPQEKMPPITPEGDDDRDERESQSQRLN